MDRDRDNWQRHISDKHGPACPADVVLMVILLCTQWRDLLSSIVPSGSTRQSRWQSQTLRFEHPWMCNAMCMVTLLRHCMDKILRYDRQNCFNTAMLSHGAHCGGHQVHIKQASNTPSTYVCHAWPMMCYGSLVLKLLSHEHLVAAFEEYQLRELVTAHQRNDKAYTG